MNSNGEGVVAWSRIDDGNPRAEASLFVPPDAIPPPPPPPPPPPVPSAIQPARKIKRGQAVILTAKVAGDVRELRWHFGGKDDPPVVGTVVNGTLDNSVRFRLPQSSFRVSVTAVGPGGARSYSRTFATPKPPTAGDAGRVARALKREKPAPVFAVADTKNLIGKGTGCSPTTIWSGEQKMAGCFEPIERLADIPVRRRASSDAIAERAEPRLAEHRADAEGHPADRRLRRQGQGDPERHLPRHPELGVEPRRVPAGQDARGRTGVAAGRRRVVRPQGRLQPEARPEEGEDPARQAPQPAEASQPRRPRAHRRLERRSRQGGGDGHGEPQVPAVDQEGGRSDLESGDPARHPRSRDRRRGAGRADRRRRRLVEGRAVPDPVPARARPVGRPGQGLRDRGRVPRHDPPEGRRDAQERRSGLCRRHAPVPAARAGAVHRREPRAGRLRTRAAPDADQRHRAYRRRRAAEARRPHPDGVPGLADPVHPRPQRGGQRLSAPPLRGAVHPDDARRERGRDPGAAGRGRDEARRAPICSTSSPTTPRSAAASAPSSSES